MENLQVSMAAYKTEPPQSKWIIVAFRDMDSVYRSLWQHHEHGWRHRLLLVAVHLLQSGYVD